MSRSTASENLFSAANCRASLASASTRSESATAFGALASPKPEVASDISEAIAQVCLIYGVCTRCTDPSPLSALSMSAVAAIPAEPVPNVPKIK